MTRRMLIVDLAFLRYLIQFLKAIKLVVAIRIWYWCFETSRSVVCTLRYRVTEAAVVLRWSWYSLGHIVTEIPLHLFLINYFKRGVILLKFLHLQYLLSGVRNLNHIFTANIKLKISTYIQTSLRIVLEGTCSFAMPTSYPLCFDKSKFIFVI